MSAPKHKCPVGGCDRPVPKDHIMCQSHWFACPGGLRDAVNRTWRAGNFKAYGEARRAAVAAVDRMISPPMVSREAAKSAKAS